MMKKPGFPSRPLPETLDGIHFSGPSNARAVGVRTDSKGWDQLSFRAKFGDIERQIGALADWQGNTD